MNLTDLASVATVISSLAVLGSLVYLAQQTRQNTRHTRALIQQGRNHEVVGFNLTFVTDPAANEILLRGDVGDPALTPVQAVAYIQIVMAQLAHAEDIFYQHKEGLVDDERYLGSVAFLQYGRGVYPGFRAAWDICKVSFGAEFRTFADEKIREAATFPVADAGAQWFSLAAKERGQMGSAQEREIAVQEPA